MSSILCPSYFHSLSHLAIRMPGETKYIPNDSAHRYDPSTPLNKELYGLYLHEWLAAKCIMMVVMSNLKKRL